MRLTAMDHHGEDFVLEPDGLFKWKDNKIKPTGLKMHPRLEETASKRKPKKDSHPKDTD